MTVVRHGFQVMPLHISKSANDQELHVYCLCGWYADQTVMLMESARELWAAHMGQTDER